MLYSAYEMLKMRKYIDGIMKILIMNESIRDRILNYPDQQTLFHDLETADEILMAILDMSPGEFEELKNTQEMSKDRYYLYRAETYVYNVLHGESEG